MNDTGHGMPYGQVRANLSHKNNWYAQDQSCIHLYMQLDAPYANSDAAKSNLTKIFAMYKHDIASMVSMRVANLQDAT